MATYVLKFGEAGSAEREIVGGKGASLGKLSARGFPVPPGFTVRTDAFRQFAHASGLQDRIAQIVESLDYCDAEALEVATGEIRRLVVETPLPADVADVIGRTYASLIGASTLVAVRSSGTAEDMEEASFAGLHDTYLNIVGVDDVLTAVRRCWASMWTARATAYRHNNRLDHMEASIAVVVQKMIEAEIAGVLFTANPLTARVDELVVNAGWGLGEGVVSGILTPDTYRVDMDTLAVRGKTLGSKEVQVIRNPETGKGTVTRQVTSSLQNVYTLDDEKVAQLSELGRRVEEFYEGIPQDIEWAYAEGTFYLLQSRDITGVEFTWDEHLESTTWGNRKDDNEQVWSTTWAEQFWTGGITPLFYSVRGGEWCRNFDRLEKLWGFSDLNDKPWFKYRRGTAYWNVSNDNRLLTYLFPRDLRAAALTVHLPPELQAAPAQVPWDLMKFVKMQARVHLLDSEKGALSWFKYIYNYIENRVADVTVSRAELRRLSDRELRRRVAQYVWFAEDFCDTLWTGFFVYGAGSMYLLGSFLKKWYAGDNADAFMDLVSGLPSTKMSREQEAMWELGNALRRSPELVKILNSSTPSEFFEKLKDSKAGREFRAKYDAFLSDYGHRGHTDRDIWYPRRCEDPSLDYNALRTLVAAGDTPSPKENEKKLQKRRQDTLDEVAANIRSRPFGSLKAETFKWLADYVVRFLKLRDDERWYIDLITLAKKVSLDEVGRRLVERGVLEGDDHYFLSQHELYELWDGKPATRLTRLKITNRRRAFHRFNEGKEILPRYMRDYTPLNFGGEDDGSLRGTGTSRGSVTGRARVVPNLGEIGTVEKGDILICNATDPGWAPVFMIIRGLVLQTGGMLAHGACLSREYGLPAVQLPGAMKRIPDGATITVNGDSGEVTIHDDQATESAPERVPMAA